MYKKRIIAVDFDGTIVKQEDDLNCREFVLLPYAKEVVSWIYDNFYVILWTCRTGQMLQNAIDFLDRRGIRFHAVNKNASFLTFETSAKIFADYYVDDRARYVDWLKIQERLQKRYLEPREIVVNRVMIEVMNNDL
jgi:hydroxymethylpyrimidine pyrophosphatase-like HAD family hydrolase